jgi:hypothetical protein
MALAAPVEDSLSGSISPRFLSQGMCFFKNLKNASTILAGVLSLHFSNSSLKQVLIVSKSLQTKTNSLKKTLRKNHSLALPIGEEKRRQTVDRHVGGNPRAHRLVDAHLQLILPRLQTLDSALGDEHCENAISRAKNSTKKSLTSDAIPVLETDELLQFADDLQSLVHGLLLGRVETQLHFVGDFLHAGINFGVLLAVLTEDLVHRARLLRLLDFFLDDGRVQVGLQAGPQLVLLPLQTDMTHKASHCIRRALRIYFLLPIHTSTLIPLLLALTHPSLSSPLSNSPRLLNPHPIFSNSSNLMIFCELQFVVNK